MAPWMAEHALCHRGLDRERPARGRWLLIVPRMPWVAGERWGLIGIRACGRSRLRWPSGVASSCPGGKRPCRTTPDASGIGRRTVGTSAKCLRGTACGCNFVAMGRTLGQVAHNSAAALECPGCRVAGRLMAQDAPRIASESSRLRQNAARPGRGHRHLGKRRWDEMVQRHFDAMTSIEGAWYEHSMQHETWEFVELSYVARVTRQSQACVGERAAPRSFLCLHVQGTVGCHAPCCHTSALENGVVVEREETTVHASEC